MVVRIAEYLGQRTDREKPISPVHDKSYSDKADLPICPFHSGKCKKTAMKKYDKAPVCSLRKNDNRFYIVCEHRLISTKKNELNTYRKYMILQAAKVLFSPQIRMEQIGYKMERRILVADNSTKDVEQRDVYHSADFILSSLDQNLDVMGPEAFIVEVQGGGETSNTGEISRHADQWAQEIQDNQFLRQKISKAGTIQTNAWRRMQEQILGKGATATKTGYGFAALIGEVIFDYIVQIMPGIIDYQLDPVEDDWNLAFIVFEESQLSNQENMIPDSIDLTISDKSLYTTFDNFIESIKSRGTIYNKPFQNDFDTVN